MSTAEVVSLGLLAIGVIALAIGQLLLGREIRDIKKGNRE